MRLTTRVITKIVALETGVPLEDITGRRRTRHIASARQLAMWVARNADGRSWYSIARAFEVNHATCIHAGYCIETKMRRIPRWEHQAKRLIEIVRGLAADDSDARVYVEALRTEDPIKRVRRMRAFERVCRNTPRMGLLVQQQPATSTLPTGVISRTAA